MSLDDVLLASVLEVLDGGPRTIDDIVQALSESGTISDENEEDLDDLFSVIQGTDLVWETVNGLYGRSDQMLDGVNLTHRLIQREIDSGVVNLIPDLDGLDLGMEEVTLVGGGRLEEVYPTAEDDNFDDESGDAYAEGSYSGPPGWLSAFSAGDLIAFHRVGEAVEVFAPDQIGSGELEKAALSDSFGVLFTANGDLGIEAIEVLLDALCVDASLFREPVAPLQELLADIGIGIDGSFLEPVDFEREMSPEAQMAEAFSNLMAQHGFEMCCLDEFKAVSEALNAWSAGDLGRIDSFGVANGLLHGGVASALVSWVFGHDLVPTATIDEFMTHILESRGAPLAAAYFVRSIARSLEGKALLAEKDIHDALQSDFKYEPARIEWALYAADRGDISAFISRLKQCESEFAQSEAEVAMDFLPRYPPTERNAPCPCGSGRKYKSCCLLSPKLTSANNQNWMLNRVVVWLARPEYLSRFTVYFEFFARHMADADADGYSPSVVDAAVFEGGGFRRYLEMKRELLSEPERELLEALVESERGLFEVTGVTPGESLMLRNVLSGETVTVLEQIGSMDCEVGEHRLGRVIKTREGPFWFGPGIKIDFMNRQAALDLLQSEYDVFEFLSWMAKLFRPSALYTPDIEDLMFCQARLRLGEDVDLHAALGEGFGETAQGHWRQNEADAKEGGISNASVRYEDGLLILDTNSAEKLDKLLETLRELLGDFEILERNDWPVQSLLENLSSGSDSDGEAESSPEAIKALESFIEELENKWLDKSLPALRGLTPREAASDPKLKEDLLTIMNDLERIGQDDRPGSGSPSSGFRAERIRAKLGL